MEMSVTTSRAAEKEDMKRGSSRGVSVGTWSVATNSATDAAVQGGRKLAE